MTDMVRLEGPPLAPGRSYMATFTYDEDAAVLRYTLEDPA